MAVTSNDKVMLASPDIDTINRKGGLLQQTSEWVTVGEIAQQSLNLQGVFNLRSVSYDTTLEIHDGVEINAGGSTVVGRAAMSGSTLTENANSWYTIVGHQAGKDMVSSSGGYITAVGAAAGEGSNGNYCVYIGNGAARLMVHGDTARNSNVAIGVGAMYLGLNEQGIAVGHEAGRNAHGLRNIHIGFEAAENMGTNAVNANDNVVIGYQAGKSFNSSSYAHTVVGNYAAEGATTTGFGMTAIGGNSLQDSNGSWNTAIGRAAGKNVVGNANVFIGLASGERNSGETLSSTGNVAVGYFSGWKTAADSDYNTLVGHQTGRNAAMGSNNTIIGANLQLNSVETFTDTVIIGSNAQERLRIDSTGSATFIGGDYLKIQTGTTASRPASPVEGMIRFNTTTNKFEGYVNSITGWVDFH